MLMFFAFGCERFKTFNLQSSGFQLFLCWENECDEREREGGGERENETMPLYRSGMIQDQDINSDHCGIMGRFWLTWAVWGGEGGAERQMGREIKVQRLEGWLGKRGIVGENWGGKCSIKKREGERSMALKRGRGRGTVHSKVWLHFSLSGSDSDGLLLLYFFVFTSRLTGPQSCLLPAWSKLSKLQSPPDVCSWLKRQKSVTLLSIQLPYSPQTESKPMNWLEF